MNAVDILKEVAALGWAAIAPLLVVVIGIYGRPLVNAAIEWLNTKTKTTLSDQDRAALQSALGNAAWRLGGKVFGDKQIAVSDSVDYLKTSIPGAMRRLDIMDADGRVDRQKAATLIEPHIERVKVARRSAASAEELPRRDKADPGSTLERRL